LRALLALTFLAALGLAVPADAQTVFSALSGTFGKDYGAITCGNNPETLSFSAQKDRIRKAWAKPVESLMRDERITVLEGDVVAWDDTSITYLRDGEIRMDKNGKPILWRLIVQGAGFCISRPDLDGSDCISVYRRCDPPMS
jgi:hypothetical protein